MSEDWYADAVQRPIAKHVRARTMAPNAVVLHVAVSEETSLFPYFAGAGVCSHFYVTRDGTIEQYLPISSKSSADYEGNNRTISIETQGGPDWDWIPEQVTAMVGIIRWANTEHGVPLRLMESSTPGEHGIGWHRLGIDGNFPASPSPYAGRVQRGGGESWSTAKGKTCPGNDKIDMMPYILSRATDVTLGSRTLKVRDQGPDVGELQRRMNALPSGLEKLDDDEDYYTLTAGRV
ncbi:MAG: N-acetylmuramoyl-L-alanine amidase, partial [Acidobacteria bacterium]|nr:N-acetylmuramoyl-L-alanine amidase [Acidobacteriota bacterium]